MVKSFLQRFNENYNDRYAEIFKKMVGSPDLSSFGITSPTPSSNIDFARLHTWLSSGVSRLYKVIVSSGRNLSQSDMRANQNTLDSFISNLPVLLSEKNLWKTHNDSSGQFLHLVPNFVVTGGESKDKMYVFYSDVMLSDGILGSKLELLIKMLNANPHCFRQAKFSRDFSRHDDFIYYLSEYGSSKKSSLEQWVLSQGFTFTHGEDTESRSYSESQALLLLVRYWGFVNRIPDNKIPEVLSSLYRVYMSGGSGYDSDLVKILKKYNYIKV